jgi:hypothetical protein
VWHRLGIARLQPGVPGEAGVPGGNQPSTSTNENHNRVNRLDFDGTAPGELGGNAPTSENNRVHQDRQPHQVETDTPPLEPASGNCWCGYPPPPGRSMHFDCERMAAEAQAEPEALIE